MRVSGKDTRENKAVIIRNLRVFQPDGSFRKQNLCIENGRFVDESLATKKADLLLEDDETAVAENTVKDGKNLLAVPGFIDLHLHGCMNADFCDATQESLQIIANYEAKHGVTSFCPTSMAVEKNILESIMKNYKDADLKYGAHPVGIHMEGPFISAKRKGAQKKENLSSCDIGWFQKLQQLSGNKIRIVDIAPETKGAMDFIQALHDEVCISIAHTDADYDTAREALQLGARHITHLFNAMSSFHHRAPGVVGAAMDDQKCRVELICDGVHLHPAVVRAAFTIFGSKRIILISDSMEATGLGDGTYTLGGQNVYVKGKRATLSTGTLAGSVTNLADCFRTAVQHMQIPLKDALFAVTRNPAEELGIYDDRGSIEPGKIADFLLMDDALSLKEVYLMGREF